MNRRPIMKLNKNQTEKLNSLTTMSGKIRYLAAIGMTRGQIAKTLKIRYQWVRNVLIQPVKNPKETVKA